MKNKSYSDYKKAKRTFASRLVKHEREQDTAFYKNVDQQANANHPPLNRLLRKRASKNRDVLPPLVTGDETLTDVNDIMRAWENHFTKLYSPLTDTSFDEIHRKDTDAAVSELEERSTLSESDPIMTSPVTANELAETIRGLKSGSCGGPDGLTYEHIKYAGHGVCSVLTILFNAIYELGHVPKEMKHNLVT